MHSPVIIAGFKWIHMDWIIISLHHFPQLKGTKDSGQDQLQTSSKADPLALEDKKPDQQKSNLVDEIEELSYIHKDHHLGISGSDSVEQNEGSNTTDMMSENPATAGEGIELTAVDGEDDDDKVNISEEDPTLPSDYATKV